MKNSLIAVAGVAMLASLATVSSSNANTTFVDLGVLTNGYSTSGSLGPVSHPDFIVFTLATPGYLELSATVSNTRVHLGKSSLELLGPTPESALFTKTNAWSAGIGSEYPGALISAGTYEFTVSPAVASSSSIGYSLNISSVPEISTWAMMLVGFTSFAFAGSRRKIRILG